MLLAATRFFLGTRQALAVPEAPSPTLASVLDRIIADRIPRNEQQAAYELPGVSSVEVRRGAFWADGRYVGELEGERAWMVTRLQAGPVTVRGRFEHLAFVIEHVANS